MIRAEKEKPNIWLHFFDGERPNIAHDPLDGLLDIMSKDPGDAEYFLDPKAPGNANEHLKFLLTDRKWPDPVMNTLYSAPMEMDDPFKATGLGNAIQAAATGHAPGEKPGPIGAHTEGQSRVMHHAIRYLDSEMNGDELPDELKNIQKPMAHALADYVADTHVILGGEDANYGGSAGKDAIHGSGNDSHIAVGQGSLVRVMRGIGDDSESFALMYESELAYSAQQLADAPAFEGDAQHGQSAEWDHGRAASAWRWAPSTGSVRTSTSTRRTTRSSGPSRPRSTRGTASTASSARSPWPVPAAGAIVDTAKFEWVQDVTDAAEEQGKKDSSENYSKGKDGLNSLYNARQTEEGNLNHAAYGSAKDTANGAYEDGRGGAAAHLGN